VTGLKDSEIGLLMRDIDSAIKQASKELENTKTLLQQNQQQMLQWENQYAVAADSLRRAQEEQHDLGNQISRGFSVRHHTPSTCTEWSCALHVLIFTI